MPYRKYLKEKEIEAKNLGFDVEFVGEGTLRDYAAMNPEAAEAMGHPCPDHKIQIQKGMGDKKTYETLNHELIEAQLMKHGWEYWTAHQFALKYEASKPGELKFIKAHDDGDQTIEYKGHNYVVALDKKNKSFEIFKDVGGSMPAKSEQQRKLFGTALAMKRGEEPITNTPAGHIARTVSERKIEEYASKEETPEQKRAREHYLRPRQQRGLNRISGANPRINRYNNRITPGIGKLE